MSEPRYVQFGPFRLDRHERLLFRDGQPVSLPRKAIDVLIALTEEPVLSVYIPADHLRIEALPSHDWSFVASTRLFSS